MKWVVATERLWLHCTNSPLPRAMRCVRGCNHNHLPLCCRLSLAAATAKGDDFGREDSSKPPPRVTRAAANQAKQIQESYKKRIKHTIKKTATGKVKRAIKRSVAAPSLGHVAKRDMEILASAGLHIRRK